MCGSSLWQRLVAADLYYSPSTSHPTAIITSYNNHNSKSLHLHHLLSHYNELCCLVLPSCRLYGLCCIEQLASVENPFASTCVATYSDRCPYCTLNKWTWTHCSSIPWQSWLCCGGCQDSDTPFASSCNLLLMDTDRFHPTHPSSAYTLPPPSILQQQSQHSTSSMEYIATAYRPYNTGNKK